jgi:ATP-binding cassette subfamily C protein LapB
VVEDKTLILITHRASLLELVERVIVVDAGKVVADGPKAQVLDALRAGRIKQTH